MKRLVSVILVAVLACVASTAHTAPSVHMRLPDAPARFLFDEPGVLSDDERAVIEDSLMAMDRRGLEIGVAVFRSTGGDAIENVSLALAEKWRPGSAEEDNGVLLVVAVEERKVRIDVGYGLEGRITDAAAGRVIRHDIAPAFREGRYGDGILRAVTSLARLAGGQPLPEPSSGVPPAVPLIIVVVVILMVIMIARAGQQATLSRRGLAGHGIPGGTYRGRSGPFWGGFGSGGGGGFGGGGGSFGGGSFGGGGASGSW
ncbi:MAG TPA: TPM domain-containing protein [Candidatus Krumholzibacteria bacterium]|nr:TPM domain-containing protein [Candidatus Krumholzibacteria bacterium]